MRKFNIGDKVVNGWGVELKVVETYDKVEDIPEKNEGDLFEFLKEFNPTIEEAAGPWYQISGDINTILQPEGRLHLLKKADKLGIEKRLTEVN